jgi:hypothetical protein
LQQVGAERDLVSAREGSRELKGRRARKCKAAPPILRDREDGLDISKFWPEGGTDLGEDAAIDQEAGSFFPCPEHIVS